MKHRHGDGALDLVQLRTFLAVVTAGGGISVLPRYLCAPALAAGTVVALIDPPDPPINTAYLVGYSTRTERPHVALVRTRLRAAAPTW